MESDNKRSRSPEGSFFRFQVVLQTISVLFFSIKVFPIYKFKLMLPSFLFLSATPKGRFTCGKDNLLLQTVKSILVARRERLASGQNRRDTPVW